LTACRRASCSRAPHPRRAIDPQVLYLAAVVTSSQDLAFVLAIAWTALNLLMSGFTIR
jgi:hypothetical protein